MTMTGEKITLPEVFEEASHRDDRHSRPRILANDVRIDDGVIACARKAPAVPHSFWSEGVDTVIPLVSIEKTFFSKRRKPGQMVEGEGIFVGTFSPVDGDGKSLGKIFNVFAAPQDLTDEVGQRRAAAYPEMVQHVAQLKNWHGFNGAVYASDQFLYGEMKRGTYNGEWVIPPREILVGSDIHFKTWTESLQKNHACGAFKDTFLGGDHRDNYRYWSSTKVPSDPHYVFSAMIVRGVDWDSQNSKRFCRPVRFVPL